MTKKNKTVYLIDDDTTILSGITLFLRDQGFQVKAYTNLTDFKESLPLEPLSVMLTDMQLASESGLDVQAFLVHERIYVPTIFLSGNSQPQQIISALKNGADDFLLKPVEPNQLLKLIENAFERSTHQLARAEINIGLETLYQTLTKKEKEVAKYIKQGYSNKMIGEILHVQPDTIKKYRAQIFEKLQCDNLPDLIKNYP
ncbi:MAG: response regulator [Methylophilaceae bacterium]